MSKLARLPLSSFPKTARVVWRAPYFSIKTAKNQLTSNRLAVIIPAAVVRTAVARHRLKRQILAAARTLPNHHLDLLFLVRQSRFGWPEIQAELQKLKNIL